MNFQCLIILLLFPCFVLAEYKLPVADDQESSPPAITGNVKSINGNILIIESGSEEVSVFTNNDTHVFTVYGGFVLVSEICKHTEIEIWYKSPEENIKTTFAAAIRVPYKCQ